ncbi:MAG: type II secretion system protein [Synergistaceae bacterium]|jgi:prepilin-type N-terminal cleavage/methylation domain-containing protein
MGVQIKRDVCTKNYIHFIFGLAHTIQRYKSSYIKRKKSFFGFSLVEMIAVLTIILSLFAMVSLTFNQSHDESKIVKQESAELATWLSERMTEAKLEEGNFKIYLSEWCPYNSQLTLLWQTGPSATKSVSYKTDKAYIRNETQAYEFVYDSKWQTLSPAVTFSIRSLSDPSKYKRQVTVSGTGYVNEK